MWVRHSRTEKVSGVWRGRAVSGPKESIAGSSGGSVTNRALRPSYWGVLVVVAIIASNGAGVLVAAAIRRAKPASPAPSSSFRDDHQDLIWARQHGRWWAGTYRIEQGRGHYAACEAAYEQAQERGVFVTLLPGFGSLPSAASSKPCPVSVPRDWLGIGDGDLVLHAVGWPAPAVLFAGSRREEQGSEYSYRGPLLVRLRPLAGLANTLTFSSPLLMLRRARTLVRRRRGLCSSCGYRVLELPMCPECGTRARGTLGRRSSTPSTPGAPSTSGTGPRTLRAGRARGA